MKKLLLIFVFSGLFLWACDKNDDKNNSANRLELLTTPTWVSDSLLVNGADAGGPGGYLAGFKGEAKFNKDGTGKFGGYSGQWQFASNQTQLIINPDSLAFPLTAQIVELTSNSLKITTGIPGAYPLNIRMTFKAK